MEGEVNNSNNKGTDSFRDYLISSKDNMSALDLSGCTLIECINKMCEIKSRSHPKIKQNYKMLIKKLETIEKDFSCTIMPAMITSVFWNHFIPFLADQKLKYSTIGHLKANLIAVLNWSSKYGVKLNPSYSEVDITEGNENVEGNQGGTTSTTNGENNEP